MITINCIENISSINLNGSINALSLSSSSSSSPPANNSSTTNNINSNTNNNNNSDNIASHKMELLVENWLNENKDWFKQYAFENLDINTVEKWLRSNNKKICKCNTSNNINSNASNTNLDKNDDDIPHLKFNLFNKRSNSLTGSSHLAKLSPTVTVTTTNGGSVGDTAKFLTASYDAASAAANTPAANIFSSCLSAKKVKFFNKDINKEDPTTTPITSSTSSITNPLESLNKKALSTSSPAMQMISTICMSHSHACIIHNRPSSSINGRNKNNVSVFINCSLFL